LKNKATNSASIEKWVYIGCELSSTILIIKYIVDVLT